jgi:hypothetical protein
MIRPLFLSVFMILAFHAYGQETEYQQLAKAEGRLQALFEKLYGDTPGDKDSILAQIQAIMPEALTMEGAMEYNWTRLDRIGVRTSEDGQFRVFTWHVADDPDHYRYFGYFQVASKRHRIEVVPLMDNLREQRGVYRLDQSTDDWYGKLYYGIVTKRSKRKTYYTLLGMDFNNSRSSIKTIEVLMMQRNKPQFVKQMFFNGSDNVDRVVLEYSTQVTMSVRYDPSMDMITFDHLVPFHPIYSGNFEFYGPDGSFDGLEFNGNSWILREDIDARLQY